VEGKGKGKGMEGGIGGGKKGGEERSRPAHFSLPFAAFGCREWGQQLCSRFHNETKKNLKMDS